MDGRRTSFGSFPMARHLTSSGVSEHVLSMLGFMIVAQMEQLEDFLGKEKGTIAKDDWGSGLAGGTYN